MVLEGVRSGVTVERFVCARSLLSMFALQRVHRQEVRYFGDLSAAAWTL